jgi:pyridoxal phosphate enzyme (YggS family)
MLNTEMLITDNIHKVRAHIPAHVTLVCVSKYQPVEAIREAYEAGERHFGESRVQELKTKIPLLPEDIRWHFIGHLQTNKVRDLLKLHPFLIHSVDSLHLLQTINDEAAKIGMVQDVLLEIHVAREETKSGFSPEELNSLPLGDGWGEVFPHVRVRGFMTMATNTDDEAEIRRCFSTLKELSIVNSQFSILSMGMSDDYRIAIECGSTMVRIGSSIFGERKKRLKAVFFDQDGVLYNSMPYHAEAWAWAMTKHGLPYTAEECYRNEGRTSVGVIQEHYSRMYGKDAPQQLIEDIYKDKTAYFNQMTGGFPGTIPGVSDVLRFLHEHGVQCWVVTGSGQHNLIDALNEIFDHVFTGIISSFDVKHGKPDPEPYLKAGER